MTPARGVHTILRDRRSLLRGYPGIVVTPLAGVMLRFASTMLVILKLIVFSLPK